jgi:hypothetical protein
MGMLQLLGVAGESLVDRAFEVGHLREAADGDLMLFDVIRERFQTQRRPSQQ